MRAVKASAERRGGSAREETSESNILAAAVAGALEGNRQARQLDFSTHSGGCGFGNGRDRQNHDCSPWEHAPLPTYDLRDYATYTAKPRGTSAAQCRPKANQGTSPYDCSCSFLEDPEAEEASTEPDTCSRHCALAAGCRAGYVPVSWATISRQTEEWQCLCEVGRQFGSYSWTPHADLRPVLGDLSGPRTNWSTPIFRASYHNPTVTEEVKDRKVRVEDGLKKGTKALPYKLFRHDYTAKLQSF